MRNEPSPHGPARRAALASAFRLELLGLFAAESPLSVSDMAARTGRPATSIYHHVEVLEAADILRVAGTRPAGKRFEQVYEMTEDRLELEHDPTDPASKGQITRLMQTALRTTERDFAAALDRDDLVDAGARRNIFGAHFHLRLPPDALAAVNERIDALNQVLAEFSATDPAPGPDDQFLSLTLTLVPIRGRSSAKAPTTGEEPS